MDIMCVLNNRSVLSAGRVRDRMGCRSPSNWSPSTAGRSARASTVSGAPWSRSRIPRWRA